MSNLEFNAYLKESTTRVVYPYVNCYLWSYRDVDEEKKSEVHEM